jgi:shikimate dehydrogenase
MRVFLLGNGVSHSKSPAMWNAVFEQLKLPWKYSLWDTSPDDVDRALDALYDPGVLGLNVTMPYKHWAAEHATDRSGDVAEVGVANWICWKRGGIHAENSDVSGARTLLGAVPPSDRVLVLGAGGAAAALLLALAGRANHVDIASRTRTRAQSLAQRASRWFPSLEVLDWSERARAAASALLIVNATPIGMKAGSPLSDFDARVGARIYDLVYSRQPTELAGIASAHQLPFVDGLGHLDAQAQALREHFGLPPEADRLISENLARVSGRKPSRWNVPESGMPSDNSPVA